MAFDGAEVSQARFAATAVTGLRKATSTDEQLKQPPPTLADMNVDVTRCSPEEIAHVEDCVRRIWEAK